MRGPGSVPVEVKFCTEKITAKEAIWWHVGLFQWLPTAGDKPRWASRPSESANISYTVNIAIDIIQVKDKTSKQPHNKPSDMNYQWQIILCA